MFSATSPLKEMEETARRIARLIREKDCRYGEIAVITGNLEEYGNLAKQVFAAAGIPYFIDEKHTVLMNPLWNISGQLLRWQYRIFPMKVYFVISDVECPV